MPLTKTRWPLFVALVAGGAALALFWLVALNNPQGEAVPASGGRYVEGVLRPPERINPLFSYANQTDADLVSLVFSGLVRLGPDGTPQPDLAERWEITNNGQRYVFHLRRGIAWQDGEEFDAEDVAFTYRAIANPDFNGDPALAQLMQGVIVTARDPLTVEFQLEQTFGPFLAYLTVGILPQHLLADLDVNQLLNAPFNVAPVGTGPYRYVGRDEAGNTELTTNSTFYLGPPHIAEIGLRVFTTQPELVAALRAGDIDGALLDESAQQSDVDSLEGDSRWNSSELIGAPYYIMYLDTRSQLFTQTEVRRALFQALNRDGLVAEIAGGRGEVSDTGIPPQSWASSNPTMPGFNPGGAATDLEAAGFFRGRDGTRSSAENVRLAFSIVTADVPERVALATSIAEQMRLVGADVDVEAVPADTFITDRLQTRAYEAALVLVDPGVDPDPYPFWHSSQVPPPGMNFASYAAQRFDRVIEDGRQTTDVEYRKDAYQLFDGYFIAEMPSFPLYAPASTYVQTNEVQGFQPRLLYAAASRFAQVNEWFMKTRAP